MPSERNFEDIASPRSTRRDALKRIVTVGTLVSAFPTVVSGAAATQDEWTRIDSCATITEPGAYYLEATIDSSDDGPCIEIHSSDVTFDGRGNELVGSRTPERSVGVAVRGEESQLSNVTISNLVVSNWDTGIQLQNAVDCTLSDNYLSLCGSAVFLNTAASTVDSNFIEDSDEGVSLRNQSRGLLTENTITSSKFSAVNLFDSTAEIRGNLLAENGRSGVTLAMSNDCSLTENIVRGNQIGFMFTLSSSDTNVSKNLLSNNETYGVFLDDDSAPENAVTSENRFANNEITDNGDDGVFLSGVRGNSFIENTIRRNATTGVELVNSDDNRFVRNVICDNGTVQLLVRDRAPQRSTGNEFRGNVIDCRTESART